MNKKWDIRIAYGIIEKYQTFLMWNESADINDFY